MQQFNQLTMGQTPEQMRETILKYGESKGFSRQDMENFLNSQK